jgi:hypothetical protein
MIARPIPYSQPMVQARRAGRKTQTRRALRIQPPDWASHVFAVGRDHFFHEGSPAQPGRCWPAFGQGVPCPYGQPGDQLWVKEEHWLFGVWSVEGRTRTGKAKFLYEADQSRGVEFDTPYSYVKGRSTTSPAWHKRIGMFMPRWASRGLDAVVSVRVERLQDISRADALAEGIIYQPDGGFGLADGSHYHAEDPRQSYFSLWESINGDGSVAANPLVWAVTFKVITP